MANDLLYKASLHLGASSQNKRRSLLYKIPTVGNRQQRMSKYGITMTTNNACDAGRLQAEQRKRSKYRCRCTRPEKAIQVSLQVSLHAT
jgi:hypothetical protein